jgi:hypothetical protein
VIVPPVSGPDPIADAEDLRWIDILIDRVSTRENITLSGRNDMLMNPPWTHLLETGSFAKRDPRGFVVVPFGLPILDAEASRVPTALANSTLKYENEITIIAQAGGTGITADYDVYIYGYTYDRSQFEELPSQVNKSFTIHDSHLGEDIPVRGDNVPVTMGDWTKLPGGSDQAFPFIDPYWKFAFNANATTANTPYTFRFDTGNVADQREDLLWDFEAADDTLVLYGFGCRAHANSLEAWIEITGDPVHTDHPEGRWQTPLGLNPIQFGAVQPEYPNDIPLFYPIPQFSNHNLIINDDRAFPRVRDNGAAIPADGTVVAVNGVRINRRG